jgi:hypothetical protein
MLKNKKVRDLTLQNPREKYLTSNNPSSGTICAVFRKPEEFYISLI